MYSIVLMAAMTATTEAPGLGDVWSKKCFWEACWPARYGWNSCGPGYSAYYPASYNSCCGCGGSYHHWPVVHNYSCHGHLGWQPGFTSCHGWHAGCGGCYGGGGCGGNWNHTIRSCGCGGGYYNCYGGGNNGGLYTGVGYAGFGAYGNFGLYNTLPIVAAPVYDTPLFNAQPVETRPIEVRPIEIKPIEVKPMKTTAPIESKASVLVRVPAEAKVYIDGNLMKSTSTERIFTSPALEPGESFYYTIRVVVEKGGKTYEDIRRVSVRAGEKSNLAFDKLSDRIRDDRAVAEASK